MPQQAELGDVDPGRRERFVIGSSRALRGTPEKDAEASAHDCGYIPAYPLAQVREGSGGSAAPPFREEADVVESNCGAGDRGDVGMVVGRRDLDDVATDEVDAAEAAEDRKRLAR